MLVALAALWLVLAALSEGLFLSPRNLVNLAVQASAVAVMACGMVLVIAARQIDLSVGSVLGFTGMVIAGLQVEGGLLAAPLPWPVALLAGLALATAIGAWHGAWVAYARLPSFVATLAGLLIFRGAAWLVSDGRTLAPLDDGYARIGGGLSGTIAGVPLPLLVLGVVALGVHVLATRTRFGRHVFAIGGNPLAAELAGIDVRA
jgi:D-xylose transport system permease protein